MTNNNHNFRGLLTSFLGTLTREQAAAFATIQKEMILAQSAVQKAQNEKLSSAEDRLIVVTELIWFTLYWDARENPPTGSITGLRLASAWEAIPRKYTDSMPNWLEDHGRLATPPQINRDMLLERLSA